MRTVKANGKLKKKEEDTLRSYTGNLNMHCAEVFRWIQVDNEKKKVKCIKHNLSLRNNEQYSHRTHPTDTI